MRANIRLGLLDNIVFAEVRWRLRMGTL
jgi:hypothetical protein